MLIGIRISLILPIFSRSGLVSDTEYDIRNWSKRAGFIPALFFMMFLHPVDRAIVVSLTNYRVVSFKRGFLDSQVKVGFKKMRVQ